MNQSELVQAIELERTRMEKMILEKNTLIDPCIISISQVLDKLINEYHELLSKINKNTDNINEKNC